MTANTHHLVWMAGVPWDGIRGTDWHMATAMTRHGRILWVDPPISPLTPARLRGEIGRTVRPLLSHVGDRVVRLTPAALPGMSRPWVRSTTAPLVRSQVRWALRKTGTRPWCVVATHLDGVLGFWGDGVVNALYATDDYVAGADLMGLSADRLRAQERRALAWADLVAAVSPQLVERWASFGTSPVLIPNGCYPANTSEHASPAVALALPRPIVGLVGRLSERIDLNVLETIADAGFSLLLVGPHDPRWEPQRFAALIARPLVHYAGRVPAEAVPAYLAAMDVGVTPYQDSPFNRASFPLKTLEYLGAGRPVVCTDLPAARWLRDDLAQSGQAAAADQILAIASDRSAFVAALRRTAGGPRKPAVADRECAIDGRCRAFAARHSWWSRADAFAAAIETAAGSSLVGSHP